LFKINAVGKGGTLVFTMNEKPTDLLQFACRTAGRVAHNPLLAEEAGERAVHRLAVATLTGRPPQHPLAWVRTIARRCACELLRNGWSRNQHLGPAVDIAECEHETRTAALREEVRAALRNALTRRQQQALEAAFSCRTTKDAAATCGMQPRDFRRYLQIISRHARREFDLPDPPPVPQSAVAPAQRGVPAASAPG
jgi:DNA-directed RNA polymerase specialized sigma24 family protein